jgi:hypothetical protein
MGLIKNYGTYGPGNKHLKFYKEGLIAVEGANTMLKMPLCNVAVPYDQFSRSRYTVPPSAQGFEINLGVINQAVTFLIIKPLYNKENVDLEANRLTYRIGTTDTVDKEFTQLLVLSGTIKRPVPAVFIDNPSDKYPVVIEVMASTSNWLEGKEPLDLLYSNLTSDQLYSADEYTLAIRDSYNKIKFFISTDSISNLELDDRMIRIDDPTHGKIGLGYTTVKEAKQALSAITWWLEDTANRLLPQPYDEQGPLILYTDIVVDNKASITVLPGSTLTPTGLIEQLIMDVIDNRDGVLNMNPDHVTIAMNGSVFKNIANTGNYTVTFKISDLAGNITSETIFVEIID